MRLSIESRTMNRLPNCTRSFHHTMSAHRINPKASVGFGHKNDFYNANRPSYPAAALNQIHQAISKSPPQDLTVLELGSGTGIFSRLILDPPSGYPEFPIKSFTALEPSSGMRDSFERNIPESTKAPVTCLDGTFSHFPEDVKDGSVDVCLIAQFSVPILPRTISPSLN